MQYPNNKYHLKYRTAQVAFVLLAALLYILVQFTWFLCAARGDIPGMVGTAIMIAFCLWLVYTAYHFQDYYGRLHRFLNKPLKHNHKPTVD
jgi:Na+/proline symporter